MKNIFKFFLGALALVLLLTCYVAIAAGKELQAARGRLAAIGTDRLERTDLIETRLHLRRAHQHLTSLPARLLSVVPVARQNVGAVAVLTDTALPVLDAAAELHRSLEALDERGVWRKGRIDPARLRELSDPVQRQARALRSLVQEARSLRSGWLVPPVWDVTDDLIRRYEPVVDRATSTAALLRDVDGLLGSAGERRYLVLLINNAELRGAGGILSGVGSIRFADGRLSMERFYPVHVLRQKPYEKVAAPRDFKRRFETYKADTTLWLNATFSPDLPDVARVASRLFRKTTGTRTQGAIVVDPRGIQALARPGSRMEIEPLDVEIPRDRLADFVYSEVYERFSDQGARRVALLETGRRVFEDLRSEDMSIGRLQELGDAIRGGHIRMVSFDAHEHRLLTDLGVAGELQSPPGIVDIHVTEQNLGSANGQGTKLDYWTERRVSQICDVDGNEAACATDLEIRNIAPEGLDEYVAGRPYGVFRAYLEIYVPASAELQGATLDGETVDVRIEPDEGHRSVGVIAEIARGDRTRYRVDYTIPDVRDGFTLRLRPQALARDARLSFGVSLPDGWRLWLPGHGARVEDPVWDRAVRVRAEPDPRSGLSAAWRELLEFWNTPL